MSRNNWIIIAVAVVVVLAAIFYIARPASPPPAVSINTPNAQVQIGSGGVSISVASSPQQ